MLLYGTDLARFPGHRIRRYQIDLALDSDRYRRQEPLPWHRICCGRRFMRSSRGFVHGRASSQAKVSLDFLCLDSLDPTFGTIPDRRGPENLATTHI